MSLSGSWSTEVVEASAREAYEAGRKAAFVAAIEECEAYASGLVENEDALTETERVIAQGDAAKHIAMRLALLSVSGTENGSEPRR